MTTRVAHLIRAIFVFVLAVLLASQVAMSLFASHVFEGELLPEMERKAAIIGQSVRGKLQDAMALGVPFARLEGVEEFFELTRANNPDLAFLALGGADGRVRHAAGIDLAAAQRLAALMGADGPAPRKLTDNGTLYSVSTLPLDAGDQRVGTLFVAVGQSFIDERIAEIHLDILTVVATSLLVAFELLMFIVSASLQQPLRQIWATLRALAHGDFRQVAGGGGALAELAERVNCIALQVNQRAAGLRQEVEPLRPILGAQVDELLERLGRRFQFAWDGRPRVLRQSQVVQVRILTFLFMFAEQLSRPFLPLLVKNLLPDGVGRGADMLAGVPITAFMLVVALGMPVAGRWIERVGARQAYTVGAAAMIVGLVGAAVPLSVYDFTLWRMLTALGYASMFMACQSFVLDNSSDADRARGASIFVGAIMVAESCAPAIGGILADRVGYRPVFMLGAIVAMVAAVLGHAILSRQHGRRAAERAGGGSGMVAALRNPRFVLIVLFAAIPAKLLLAGFLFYLVPVVLAHMGAGQAATGRIIMAYGLPCLILMPAFSALADRLKCHGLMVGLGGMLAGAGLLPVLFEAQQAIVLLGVFALGIGQAMTIAPQLAMVTQVCRDEIARHGSMAVIGLYRLLERIGAAMGALVAGALTAAYGPVEAMALLGAGCFACAVVFSAAFLVLGQRPEDDDPPQAEATP